MAKSIAKLSVSLTASTGKFTKGMEKSTKSTEGFMRSMGRMTKRVAAFTAAIAAAGVATLAYQMRKAAGSIDSLAKASDKLGIATEKLQALRMAAELTGVASNTLDMAIQRMVRRVAEAAQGSGEAVKALEELGLSAEYLNTLSPDEQFKAIAQAMQGVANQGDKVRLAMRLFDSEGVALVNTLALGADGLNQVEQRMRSMGLTISRLDAAQVEKMNDSISILRQLMDALWQRVTVAVAPAIDAFAKSMEKGVAESDLLNRATKFIVKTLAVGVAVVQDIGRGLKAMFLIAKISILGTLNLASMMVEGIADVAVGLAEFTGVGVKAAKNFQQTVSAMGDSISSDVGDAVESLKKLSEEESSVLALGETFRRIDESVDSIGKGTDEIAHNMDAAATDADKMLKRLSELEQFAERIKEQTMTPLERFEEQISKLREALKEGFIDEETFKRAVEQAEKALADATATVGETASEPKTSDFRQIRLSQVALNGVRSVSARPQQIESDQLDHLIALGQQLVRGGAFARVAV